MKNENNKCIQGDLFDGWDTSKEKIDEQMKMAHQIMQTKKDVNVKQKQKAKPKQQWGVAGIIFAVIVVILGFTFMTNDEVNIEVNNTTPLFNEKF